MERKRKRYECKTSDMLSSRLQGTVVMRDAGSCWIEPTTDHVANEAYGCRMPKRDPDVNSTWAHRRPPLIRVEKWTGPDFGPFVVHTVTVKLVYPTEVTYEIGELDDPVYVEAIRFEHQETDNHGHPVVTKSKLLRFLRMFTTFGKYAIASVNKHFPRSVSSRDDVPHESLVSNISDRIRTALDGAFCDVDTLYLAPYVPFGSLVDRRTDVHKLVTLCRSHPEAMCLDWQRREELATDVEWDSIPPWNVPKLIRFCLANDIECDAIGMSGAVLKSAVALLGTDVMTSTCLAADVDTGATKISGPALELVRAAEYHVRFTGDPDIAQWLEERLQPVFVDKCRILDLACLEGYPDEGAICLRQFASPIKNWVDFVTDISQPRIILVNAPYPGHEKRLFRLIKRSAPGRTIVCAPGPSARRRLASEFCGRAIFAIRDAPGPGQGAEATSIVIYQAQHASIWDLARLAERYASSEVRELIMIGDVGSSATPAGLTFVAMWNSDVLKSSRCTWEENLDSTVASDGFGAETHATRLRQIVDAGLDIPPRHIVTIGVPISSPESPQIIRATVERMIGSTDGRNVQWYCRKPNDCRHMSSAWSNRGGDLNRAMSAALGDKVFVRDEACVGTIHAIYADELGRIYDPDPRLLSVTDAFPLSETFLGRKKWVSVAVDCGSPVDAARSTAFLHHDTCCGHRQRGRCAVHRIDQGVVIPIGECPQPAVHIAVLVVTDETTLADVHTVCSKSCHDVIFACRSRATVVRVMNRRVCNGGGVTPLIARAIDCAAAAADV